MNFLDMRTVVFSHLVTDALCVLVIASLWYQNRKRFAGTSWWLLDFAFQATATLLIILRGSIPDWMSMVVANTLVIAGALAGYIGLERFVGKTSSQVHNYLLLAAFAGVHTYFTFAQPNLAARNLNVSLGLLIVSFQCAWLILRRVRPDLRRMMLKVGLIFGAFCLISLVRIVVILASPQPGNDFFQSGAFDTLILMSYQMLLILLAYSLTLMVNGRLLVEIQTQEETLRAISSRQQALLTAIPDIIVEVDKNKVFTWTNPAGLEFYGEEVLGKEASFYFEGEQDTYSIVTPLFGGSEDVTYVESWQRRKDGEKRLLAWWCRVLKDSGGNVIGALSTARDITARKRTELELVSAQERLKEAHRLAHIGTWDWVIENDTVTWSEELCHIAGRDPSLPAPTYAEHPRVYTPASWALLSSAVTRALTTGEPYNLELELIRPDNSLRWTNAFGGVKRDGAGKVIGLHGTVQDITERKQADEALRESERKLKALFELLPVGVSVLDADSHVSYVNPALEKILDITRAGLLRGDYRQRIYLRGDGTVMPTDEFASVRAAREQRAVYNIVTGMVKDDGQVVWANVNAVPVAFPDWRIVIATTDITALKHAEEKAAQLAAIVESSDDIIISKTLDGIITTWNKGAERIYGYTEGEMIGRHVSTLAPPERAEETPQILDQIKTGLHVEHFETVRRRKDGQPIHVSLTISPIRDMEGRIIAASTIGRDITDRKRAEEALLASQANLSALIENTDGSIWATNSHYALIVGNNLFQRNVSAALGRPLKTSECVLLPGFPAAVNVEWQGYYDRALRGERFSIETLTRFRADPEYIEYRFNPILDESGNVTGVTVFGRDITARKQAVDALRDLNATLEQRVADRTAELLAANEHLTELDRMKDEFMSRLSHELRTPLTSIKIYIELLETAKPEKRDKYLQTLKREADRLHALVEGVLTFTQLSQDTLDIELNSVDLNRVLEPRLAAWQEMAARRALAFRADLAQPLPPTPLDDLRTLQVVALLINNAVNYTPAGSITLATRACADEAGRWLTVSVTDTGPGITPDDLPHIFERFYRGRAAADYKTPGTGVGLSIGRQIAEKLGGRLTVETQVGVGSTFTLWLPTAR